MKNLLYKEFKLSVHPLYLILAIIFGALMMIPQWFFLLVPLYFCFISVPNLLGQYKANNDAGFSTILPVTKEDIVKARIITFVILELLHLFFALLFLLLHNWVYGYTDNFALNPNLSYFGICFVMFGLFNVLLFPLYYKTAYKYGPAVIIAVCGAIIVAVTAETLAMVSPVFQDWTEQRTVFPVIIFIGGFFSFILANFISAKIAVKRFLQIDL